MSAPDPSQAEPAEEKREPDFILRSNRIAGLLTLATLVTTVGAVYAFVPVRDNELMTQAAIEHREDHGDWDLQAPSYGELAAWSRGAMDAPVPWPEPGEGVELMAARTLHIQKRRAALVRYRVDGLAVTLVVQRGRDVPPRKHRRRDGGDDVLSWRSGMWTLIAVGPSASYERWRAALGAPSL